MHESGQEASGDPVCWLSRVCQDCGLFAEAEPPTTCERCGAPIGQDEEDPG